MCTATASTPSKAQQRDLWQNITVKDLITWNVSVISPQTTLEEILYLFATIGIEIMVVYDGPLYQGVVTQRAVTKAKGDSLGRERQQPVSDTIDSTLRPISPYDLLWNIYQRMRKAGHTHLPVLDDKGKLAGLLSLSTIESRYPSFPHQYHLPSENL
jgi:CBS domain-containing protein